MELTHGKTENSKDSQVPMPLFLIPRVRSLLWIPTLPPKCLKAKFNCILKVFLDLLSDSRVEQHSVLTEKCAKGLYKMKELEAEGSRNKEILLDQKRIGYRRWNGYGKVIVPLGDGRHLSGRLSN